MCFPFFQPSRVIQRLVSASILAMMLSSRLIAAAEVARELDLQEEFRTKVQPFMESHCLKCHDHDEPEAEFDLSRYGTAEAVAADFPHWALVLERLQEDTMPPSKTKTRPAPEEREGVIRWIEAVRDREARRNAGDPGPVLARRLSNAEYDYSIHDLTGADIRPTRTFPVDPANQAGFDNSGESLTMSPALVKKYLQAAREVAEHLVLQPDGFAFAPHPVMADTDRDKWAVFRIVDFYRRQPTDYAEYFLAAWRYEHRKALGHPDMTLAQAAAEAKLSAKYLTLVRSILTESGETAAGPIAQLQAQWHALPAPDAAPVESVRAGCEAMRDYILPLRQRIVPEVKNLAARPIQTGSQTLVMWKNRQMAANRRRFDPGALRLPSGAALEAPAVAATAQTNPEAAPLNAAARHQQAPTVEAVKRGGISLPPAVVMPASSATSKMAASNNNSEAHPDLVLPEDLAQRGRYEAALARFADVFPDAFYISERARVYLNAEKEQENAGRLLSAGLHSMTGYFRDDGPLYDLILDDAGRTELDRLWREFDFAAAVPQRMHTSFVWFERTDSSFMRDPEFDLYRPEDKSVTSQEKIRSLAELYLAKAVRNSASRIVQGAIADHFRIVAENVRRVEQDRIAAEPTHLKSLEHFTARAWRRALEESERKKLYEFYQASRNENGGDHEEALRGCIMRVLMSPNFCYRIDLLEAAGGLSPEPKPSITDVITLPHHPSARPLSSVSLASRLSYFLWASLPDEALMASATSGELSRPDGTRAQVRRMLKDARVRNFAVEFAGNWLDFRRFNEHNSVDRERFPAFNDALRRAMFEEPVRFLVDVIQADRPVRDFLYAEDTFVNAPLAAHYDIPFPETADGSETWRQVEQAGKYGRGGLLPMAVFLTVNSPGLRTSPVKRGNWVVKRLFGERIPPPPSTVPELPGDEKNMGDLTLREVLAKHRENEACAGCHARFDSFGLVFESYGPVGEWRQQDLGGRPVDTHAEFPGGGAGTGLAGLREYILGHREDDFKNNLCRRLLAYALGRTLILSDEELIREMRARLAAHGDRFGSLIECIVTSPQFLTGRSRGNTVNN